MKYLLLLALTLGAFTAEAQKEQICKVREQNSKRKPLPNVQVIFEDAPAAVSQTDGTVRLLFQNRKAGEWTFKLDINRAGYELVNEKEVEKVKLSADNQFGVDIILARAGVVDSIKAIYYGVSNTSLKKGFEREKAKLRQERDAARLTAEQHVKQLEALNKEYENQKKNLDDLSEKFARVNFDDVDSVYQQALELFKAGEVTKAIEVLEAIDPAKRTGAIIKKGVFLDSLYAVYHKEKHQQIANLRLLAEMYSATFDPAKAENQYDQLLRLDSTDLEILWDAAEFYKNNHRYDKALRTYPLVIGHPKAEGWQVANVHRFMGEMHTATGNLDGALDAFTTSFEYYEKLYRSDPERSSYKNGVATLYQFLGDTYRALGDLPKALTFFEPFNQLMIEMNEAFPQNMDFKYGLAVSYQFLGETHTALGNLPSGLIFFEKTSSLFKELHESYPQDVDFKNGLAISFQFLGSTHTTLGDLPRALIFFEEYNRLEKELHEYYPQNVDFKNLLAISFQYLGITHRALSDLPRALIFFEEYSRLENELHESYPQNVDFKNLLATSFSRLGSTHMAIGDLPMALTFFEKDIELSKELLETYPQNVDFKYGLAISYSKLGEAYWAIGDLPMALTFFEKEIELSKELYETYPENFNFKNGFAISNFVLGDFYSENQNNIPLAILHYKKADSLWTALIHDSPENIEYQQNLAEVWDKLAKIDGAPLETLPSPISEDTIQAFVAPSTIFKLTKKTRLRDAPSQDAKSLLLFKPGDQVSLLEKTNKFWWKVFARDKTGYVKAASLKQ